jgi:methylmalonyl-CoA mutase
MTVHDEEFSLAAAFPAATRARWQALVKSVLRRSGVAGEDTPHESVEALLSTTSYDGVTIAPLYTAADEVPWAGLPGLPPYIRGVRPDGAILDGWDVRQRHADPDPQVAKRAVLTDLENGVTSLWLVLGDGGLPVAALPEVLAEVYIDLAAVVLDAGTAALDAAGAFLGLLAKRGVKPDRAAGNLGADPLGVQARTGLAADMEAATVLAARCARDYHRLRAITVDALPYHDAGGSHAEELGCALAAGVAYLRALTHAGLAVDAAFGQLEFRYAATADQFLTIAKLRAARRLWNRVGEVCGAGVAARGQRQHVVTSSAMMTARDPWVNMLRTALACFGAGIGGADAVTVQPFDAALGLPDDFARRIARNTQSVLLEESIVARVIDPAGGSWYVERLTDDLAKAAWAWFTEIEKAGGFRHAQASGLIADRLGTTWAKRQENIARRRDPITGVSEFPSLAEQALTRTPHPVGSNAAGGLPRVRYAQSFEALRDRVDAHVENTGARPAVFLATLGPIAAHTRRATFAANLFQAGGIQIIQGGPETDPAGITSAFTDSGTSVACICSSDTVYAASAGSMAGALKAAGATRVWLAGKPGERADEWEGAGIDGYLFAGCNAIDVVRTTLADLGVA